MVVDCDSSDSSSLSSHAVEIFPTAPPPVSSSRDTIVVGYVFGPKKMKTMGDVMMLTAEATARVASAAAPSGCDVSIISADTHSDGGPSTPSPVHHFMPSSVMTRISNSKSAIEDDCTSVQSSGSSGSSSLGSSLSLMDLSPSFGLLNNGQNINKVKFVPLNLDAPLEQQHGGHFDCILHKLTEDLLSVTNTLNPAINSQSRIRLDRLTAYCESNSLCTLIDPPNNVQKLMSRASIASILSSSLTQIKNPSFTVRAPAHAIINRKEDIETNNTLPAYPLIAKPLDAAGTVQSHKMTVVLKEDGLQDLTTPCLLQSFENHGGVLFKVYVLGDHVRVFPRPSLPNLPFGAVYEKRSLDFDSQKPYPGLVDFGVGVDTIHEQPTTSPAPTHLTLDEVLPIADNIRRTFGLDLFGFDVLVRDSEKVPKELIVVDVNYFPSYKELYKDFPLMLAEFLIRKATDAQ